MASFQPIPWLQVSDDAGAPLVGGKIWTYASGTTTPKATYSDSALITPNTNPIILNARGEAQMALGSGAYSLKLLRSDDTLVKTIDSVTDAAAAGAVSAAAATAAGDALIRSDLAASTGAGLLGWIQLGLGAVFRWVRDKLRETVSVKDFGALMDGITDDTAAIQAADNAATLSGSTLFFPAGTAMISNVGITRGGCSWVGAGKKATKLKALAQTFANLTGLVNGVSINDHATSGITFDVTNAIFPPGVGNPGNIFWIMQFVTSNGWKVTECAFTGIKPHVLGLAVNGGNNWRAFGNDFNMPVPTGAEHNQAINVSVASGAVSGYAIQGNVCIGTGIFSNGSYGLITGNYVTGWKFGGGLTFGPLSTCIGQTIEGNICVNSSGLDVNNTYPSGIECWSAYSRIANNYCIGNSGSGVLVGNVSCTVSGNNCQNNGQSGAANGHGIVMYSIPSFGASSCLIDGNICFDSQSTKTQGYGYAEFVVGGIAMNENMIVENNFSGNATGRVLLATAMTSTRIAFRGPQITMAGYAVAPPVLADGGLSIFTITMIGARLGDIVTLSYSQDLQAVNLQGYVAPNDTVIVIFANKNGVGARTLAAGNLNILVEKPVGYGAY